MPRQKQQIFSWVPFSDCNSFSLQVESSAAPDTFLYGDVHWQHPGAGQVHKLHLTHVRVWEVQEGIVTTGTQDTKAFRFIVGFKDMQLTGRGCVRM